MTAYRCTHLQALTVAACFGILLVACDGPPIRPTTPGPVWIGEITPSSIQYNTSAQVTIRGAGFQPGATVTIGGQATDVAYANSNMLTARTPVRDAGVVDVTVTNPDGGIVTRAKAFAWQDLTARLNQSAGFALDEAEIVGTGFKQGVQVSVDGQPADILTSNSPGTAITIRLPEHAPGVVSMVVSNPDGRSVGLPSAFTYYSASLWASAAAVDPGGSISVSWLVPAGQEGMILLYRVGASNQSPLWRTDQTDPTGSVALTAPLQPGSYIFHYYLWIDWDHAILKTFGAFVVNSPSGK